MTCIFAHINGQSYEHVTIGVDTHMPYLNGICLMKCDYDKIVKERFEHEEAKKGFKKWQSLPILGVIYFETY
jgi:hypothetical protein